MTVLEVSDDRVGESGPCQIEIGIGTQLPLAGEAPPRSRYERSDFAPAVRVDVQVGESLLAGPNPGLAPGRQPGRGAPIESLELAAVVRQRHSQIFGRPGVGGGQPL